MHSSIKITYDVYGSSFTLHDEQASDDLAASLFGDTTGNTGTSK